MFIERGDHTVKGRKGFQTKSVPDDTQVEEEDDYENRAMNRSRDNILSKAKTIEFLKSIIDFTFNTDDVHIKNINSMNGLKESYVKHLVNIIFDNLHTTDALPHFNTSQKNIVDLRQYVSSFNKIFDESCRSLKKYTIDSAELVGVLKNQTMKLLLKNYNLEVTNVKKDSVETRMIDNLERYLLAIYETARKDGTTVHHRNGIISSVCGTNVRNTEITERLGQKSASYNIVSASEKLREDFDAIYNTSKSSDSSIIDGRKKEDTSNIVESSIETSIRPAEPQEDDDENEVVDTWYCEICKKELSFQICENCGNNLVADQVSDDAEKTKKLLKKIDKVMNNNVYDPVFLKPEKSIRSDKLNNRAITDFCHESEIGRIDTHQSKRLVKVSRINYDGSFEAAYEETRILQVTIEEAFEMFLKSEWHENWLRDNVDYSKCSKSNFGQNLCPCLKKKRQIDTADEIEVELAHALQAWSNMRMGSEVKKVLEECKCSQHQDAKFKKICSSKTSLLQYLLCEKILYDELNITAYQTKEEVEEIKMENMNAVNEKIKQLRIKKGIRYDPKAENFKNATAIPDYAAGGEFCWYEEKCGSMKCGKCGPDLKLFGNGCCLKEFDCDPNQFVKVLKYDLSLRGENRLQKEIKEVQMNQDELLQHLKKCVKRWLPHHWSCVWYHQNVKARTERMELGDVTLSQDYSAIYNCHPNNALNSAIPGRCMQLVSLVRYIDLIPDPTKNSKRKRKPNSDEYEDKEHQIKLIKVVRNIAYSFWAESAKTVGYLTQHSSMVHKCNEYILCDLKARNIKIKNLYIDQDGCASQFKSKYAAYFNKMLVMCGYAENVIVSFAPTASGNGAVNGIGNCKKENLRNVEKREAGRLPDAEAVVKYLQEHYTRKVEVYENRRPGTIDEYVDVLVRDVRTGPLGGTQEKEELLSKQIRVLKVQIDYHQVDPTIIPGILSLYNYRIRSVDAIIDAETKKKEDELIKEIVDLKEYDPEFSSEEHYKCDKIREIYKNRYNLSKDDPFGDREGKAIVETRKHTCSCNSCMKCMESKPCTYVGTVGLYRDTKLKWKAMVPVVGYDVDLPHYQHVTNF